MRGAAAMLVIAAAACGGKKNENAAASDDPARKDESVASCDARRRAASRAHVAFTQEWLLHAEGRTPAALCAALAKETNTLKDMPSALLADLQAAAGDTSACTKDPQAHADKLDQIATAYDAGLDGKCPPAIRGAGEPK